MSDSCSAQLCTLVPPLQEALRTPPVGGHGERTAAGSACVCGADSHHALPPPPFPAPCCLQSGVLQSFLIALSGLLLWLSKAEDDDGYSAL